MMEQDVLDLLRIHVLTGDIDHVVLPADEVVVPVGVAAQEVAGVEPAVAELAGGDLGQLPVTLSEPGIPGDQLADALALDHATRLVDEVDVGTGEGQSAAPAL